MAVMAVLIKSARKKYIVYIKYNTNVFLLRDKNSTWNTAGEEKKNRTDLTTKGDLGRHKVLTVCTKRFTVRK